MELPLGAGVGALRVGIQVISNHRKPAVEFYFELHNDFGPEHVTPPRNVNIGTTKFVTPESRHRSQDIFASFSVINIGGVRAENVMLSISENVRPDRPILKSRFGIEIPQLAPGQPLFLFRLDQHDLFNENGNCKFNMAAEYNAPWRGLNRMFRIPCHLRRTKQYRTNFDFDANVMAGDLPPPKYRA